jgi:hypothetical protein
MANFSGKRLYEVRLANGAQNRNYMKYLDNSLPHNPKAIDLGGGVYHAMVSHHMDADTLHLLLTDGFKKGTKDDLTVEEVTKQSLRKQHIAYEEMVENRFLPYDKYPNIS